MTLPYKVDSGNSETTQKNSLLARWLGSADAAERFRQHADRAERSRLRMSIARGSEWDHRGDRTSTPAAAAPGIDKGRLAAWLRGELGKIRDECRGLIREQVAAACGAIEDSIAEALDERLVQMEDQQ